MLWTASVTKERGRLCISIMVLMLKCVASEDIVDVLGVGSERFMVKTGLID